MATIITVHRGELLQIKRMIEKGKGKGRLDLRGDVYGLRTESRQPVIQFVCSRDDKEQIRTLKDGHGLLKLGEWVVRRSEKLTGISRNDVVLVFCDKGDLITAYFNEKEATLDILKGQSAFRLYEPLINNASDLVQISTEEYDKEHELKEVQVTKLQWYSAPDGVKLLQEMYQSFPQAGLTDLDMRRDKETEDISLSLTAESTNIIVHFPPNFPYKNPKVRLDDQNEWSELELEYEEEKSANLLCDSLLNFVKKENKKKQQQKQSNKKGDEQHPPMGKNYQQQQDERPTGQEQTPITGEHDQQRDERPTGQEQTPLTGEHDKQRDERPTGQEQTPITGEHDQQRDERPTGQEQTPITGEHDQQRDERPTGQEQTPLTGEHDKQRDERPTGQEQTPITGEHDQQRDERPTGQEQTPLTGEHDIQRDERPTGQEQTPLTGEHDQQRDERPTGQEQTPITGERDPPKDEPSTDEVTEQNPGEAMDIEKPQGTSEENRHGSR